MKKALLLSLVLLVVAPKIFSQTVYQFTNCGATGRYGPTQAQVNANYGINHPLNGDVVSNNGVQQWTVPVSGNYRIEAAGGNSMGVYYSATGGKGARIAGDFFLTAGTVLNIVVGQQGSNNGSGSCGGGGSFVFKGTVGSGQLYIVAGGGGGYGHDVGFGGNGSATNTPVNGGGRGSGGYQAIGYGGNGGSGSGGFVGTWNSAASGGAGWRSDGLAGYFAGSSYNAGSPGTRFVGGVYGGNSSVQGGFGGGGACAGNGYSGGGGGGYTGGGGGNNWPSNYAGDPGHGGGQGGGSYNAGANQTNTAGANAGMGFVTITNLTTPATGLNFDGVNDYVSVANGHPGGNEVTYEGWVNPSNLSGFRVLVNHNGWSYGYHHLQFINNQLEFAVNSQQSQYAGYNFSINTWYHIAVVYSATTKTAKFYVNGNLTNTASYSSSVPVAANVPYSIGSWNGSDRFFAGTMDEFRIWNRALCQGEIQNNMNCELSGGQGLEAQYTFNNGFVNHDNTGVTGLVDASGNNRNGVLNNFALTGGSSNWGVGKVTGVCSQFFPPLASINADGPTTFCAGQSVVLSANSGASYLWSNGATTPSITVTASETYTVTVTMPNGCVGKSDPVSIMVTPNPVVTVAASGPTTFCPGGNVTLTASGATTYQWSNGSTASSITANTTGTYSVTGTTDGCTSAPVATIVTVADTQPPVITLNSANGALSSLGPVNTYPTSVAGSGTLGLSHAHGIAYDLQRNTVWVTDQDLNNDVLEFPATQANNTTISPVSRFHPAMTSVLEGIAFDATDNSLWIVDYNGYVGHFDRTGAVLPGAFNAGTTIPAGTFGARGLGIALQGNYIWVDNGARAYRFNKSNGSYTNTNFVTGAPGITFDPERNLLWSSGWNDGRYRAYDPATGNLVFTSNVVSISQGHDLSIGAGRIWVASENSHRDPIYSIQINGGAIDEIIECGSGYTDPGYTATDNCGTPVVIVSGTVNSQAIGTYQLNYTATDASNNSSTVTRTITVLDRTAPVPVVSSLPVITASCSVTLTAPTANDGCAGVVTATTTNPVTYTTEGTYTVKWTYSDGNGNSSVQTQTVVIDDNIAPVPNTPSLPTLTGSCEVNVGAAPTATDNCTGQVTGTTTDPLSYSAQGTYTITWKFNDGNGNESSQTQTVVVKDVTPPVIACPFNITVNAAPNSCGAVVNYNQPSATDNCGNGNLPTNIPGYTYKGTFNGHTYFLSNSATTPENAHAQAIALGGHLATIGSEGENAFISAMSASLIWIGITDRSVEGTYKWVTSEPVTFTKWNNGEPNNAGDEDWAVINWGPNGTWNDWTYSSNALYVIEFEGGSIPTTLVSGPASGSTFPVGTTTVTYQATDAGGNVASCSFTVTVVDNQPPTIGCPVNQIISTCTNTIDNYVAMANAADNCGTVTVTQSPAAGTPIAPGATIIVTLSATDAAGLVRTCSFTVTRRASLAIGSAVTNVSCFAGNNGAVNITVNGGAAPYSYNWSNGNATEDLSNVVAGTYTVTVTDANNCTITGTYTVNQPTQLSATSTRVNNLCYGDNAGSITVSATGGTSPYQYSIDGGNSFQSSNSFSNLAAQQYSLVVRDANGCTTAAQDVTITQPTQLQFTTAVTNVSCNGGSNASVVVSASGGMGGSSSSVNWNGWSDFEDQSMNVPATSNVTTLSIGSTSAMAHSHYGNVNVSIELYNSQSSSWVVVYSNTLGSYGQVSFSGMNLNFPAIPQVTAIRFNSSPAQYNTFHGFYGTIPITIGGSSYSYSINGGAYQSSSIFGNLSAGSYNISVKDANGCTKSQSVTVTEPTPLQAAITSTTNVTCPGGSNGSATVAGNGGTAPYTYSWAPYGGNAATANGLATGTYTVTVRDAKGCTQTAAAVISQVDPVAPTVLTKNITVYLNANGTAGITSASVDNGSSDNCEIASMSLDKTSFDCSNVGANTVTLSVTDNSGNQSSATAVVTVADNLKPIVNTQPVTIYLDGAGNATTTAAAVNNGSTDNCGIASMSLDKTSFNCSNVGANTVTLTVTDVNGNSSSKTAVVTVVDNIAPAAVSQPVTIYLDAAGAASVTAAAVNNGSFDNCGVQTISLDKTSFNCSNVGPNTVTLTVTDVNGNISSTTAVVTVVDNIAPTVVTQPVTIYLDAAGNAATTAGAVNNGSTDNCGIANISLDKTSFNCSNVGANTVTLTVTDVNGNSSSKTATVTVVDNIAPTAVSQPVTIYLDAAGNASTTAAAVNNGSSDNCAVATLSLDKTSFNCSNVGANTVTLTVTDVNGNSSSTTAVVTVVDNIAPSITCAASQSVLVDHTVCAYEVKGTEFNATATDNCAVASYTYTLTGATTATAGSLAGVLFNKGTTTVTVTATDVNGNTSVSCSYSVTVSTTLAATISSSSVLPQGVQPNTIYVGYTPASVLTLTANPTGGGAGYTYNWSVSSNLSISGANNGSTVKVTSTAPNSASAYTVTLVVTDVYGCSVTKTWNVNVVDVRCGNKNDKVLVCHKTSSATNPWVQICIAPAAVATHLANGSTLGSCATAAPRGGVAEPVVRAIAIKAYPNPTTGVFELQLQNYSKGKVQIQVVDNYGKLVYDQSMVVSHTNENTTIDVRKHASGVYFVRVVGEEGVKTLQVVVAK